MSEGKGWSFFYGAVTTLIVGALIRWMHPLDASDWVILILGLAVVGLLWFIHRIVTALFGPWG